VWHICNILCTHVICGADCIRSGYQSENLICVFVHAYISTPPPVALAPPVWSPEYKVPVHSFPWFSCNAIWSHHNCRKAFITWPIWIAATVLLSVAMAYGKLKPCFQRMCYVITCRCTFSAYHTPPCHTVDIYWNYLLAISYTIISYLINASVIYRKAGRQSHGFVQMIRAAQDTKAIPSVQRKPITWWQPQGQVRLWR